MQKSNYIIREMQTADLSAVLLIEQAQLFPWTLKQLQDCLQANYYCCVITLEKKIIGFAILMLADDQADVINIAIDSNHRRQGLGRLLLQHLIEQTQRANITQLFLEVRISNQAAIYLYEKMHFKIVAQRKNYYQASDQQREDALVMMLKINLHDAPCL